MVFLHSMGGILTILIIIVVGYLMTKAGWLNDHSSQVMSKIIIKVALPCYMFYNVISSLTRSKLISMGKDFIIPFASIGICYIIGIIVSNVLKVKKGRKGVFRSVFFTSNTIYIGLAVNLSLFGESSVPYVLLYYIANTTFFWTFGVYEISKDGIGANTSIFSMTTLKRIVSPPLLGFSTGIVLLLCNIHLPNFLLDSVKYLGNLTTPLALIFIGIVLYSVNLRNIRIDRDIIILSIGRFLICPMLVLLLEHFFVLPDLMGKVLVIQASMPAMTNTSVIAKSYGSDYEFATVITVFTTILSLLVIPIYMCTLR